LSEIDLGLQKSRIPESGPVLVKAAGYVGPQAKTGIGGVFFFDKNDDVDIRLWSVARARGIFDREEAEKDLVEQREDRGVCSDPQPQGQYRYSREAGRAPQGSQRIVQIANPRPPRSECVHWNSPLLADFARRHLRRRQAAANPPQKQRRLQHRDERTRMFVS